MYFVQGRFARVLPVGDLIFVCRSFNSINVEGAYYVFYEQTGFMKVSIRFKIPWNVCNISNISNMIRSMKQRGL